MAVYLKNGRVLLDSGEVSIDPGCCCEGACCAPDGSCSILGESDCTDSGGVYKGDNSICDDGCHLISFTVSASYLRTITDCGGATCGISMSGSASRTYSQTVCGAGTISQSFDITGSVGCGGGTVSEGILEGTVHFDGTTITGTTAGAGMFCHAAAHDSCPEISCGVTRSQDFTGSSGGSITFDCGFDPPEHNACTLSISASAAPSINVCNGQCCFEDGGCLQTNADLCHEYGGVFSGYGTVCSAGACVGACCLFSGGPNCFITTSSGCNQNRGSYAGNGSTCETHTCCGWDCNLSENSYTKTSNCSSSISFYSYLLSNCEQFGAILTCTGHAECHNEAEGCVIIATLEIQPAGNCDWTYDTSGCPPGHSCTCAPCCDVGDCGAYNNSYTVNCGDPCPGPGCQGTIGYTITGSDCDSDYEVLTTCFYCH